eukprot:XP_022261577.1 uncharacterized protein LOC102154677 [Canis lupus familiaris]
MALPPHLPAQADKCHCAWLSLLHVKAAQYQGGHSPFQSDINQQLVQQQRGGLERPRELQAAGPYGGGKGAAPGRPTRGGLRLRPARRAEAGGEQSRRPRPHGRSSCPRLAVRGALVAGRPRRGPPARVGPWGGGRCSPTLGLPPSLPLRATRPSSRWRRRGLGVGASARPPGAGSSRDPVTRAPRPCGAASDEEADGAGAGGRPRAWAENGRRGPAPGGCGWRPRPLPAGTERHEGDRHGQSAALGDRGPPGVSAAAPPRVDPAPQGRFSGFSSAWKRVSRGRVTRRKRRKRRKRRPRVLTPTSVKTQARPGRGLRGPPCQEGNVASQGLGSSFH